MDEHGIQILSQLGQIALTADEERELAASIDEMLEYFSHMNAFDAAGEQGTPDAINNEAQTNEATAHAKEIIVDGDSAERKEVDATPRYLDNAPETEGDFFVVPHII